MPRFQTVTYQRIYDEKSPDDYLEICPDADTGDLVEIRAVTLTTVYAGMSKVPEITNRIAFDPEAIPNIIEALQHFRKV